MFYYDIMRDIPLEKIVSVYQPKNGLYLQMCCANNITKFPLDYLKYLEIEEKEQKSPSKARRMTTRSMSEARISLNSTILKEALNQYQEKRTRDGRLVMKGHTRSQAVSKSLPRMKNKSAPINLK